MSALLCIVGADTGWLLPVEIRTGKTTLDGVGMGLPKGCSETRLKHTSQLVWQHLKVQGCRGSPLISCFTTLSAARPERKFLPRPESVPIICSTEHPARFRGHWGLHNLDISWSCFIILMQLISTDPWVMTPHRPWDISGWSNCISNCQDRAHETGGSELVERQWKKNTYWCRIDLAYPCVGRWDLQSIGVFSKLFQRANHQAVMIWMMIWMCLTRQQNLRA